MLRYLINKTVIMKNLINKTVIMKTKAILILSVFLFLININWTFGQEKEKKDLSIQIHTNLVALKSSTEKSYNQDKKHSSTIDIGDAEFGYFLPSVRINKSNNNFHEFSLTQLLVKNNTEKIYFYDSLGKYTNIMEGQKIQHQKIALRYSYNIRLFKQKQGRFQSFIGSSVEPYFSNKIIKPYVSSEFPNRETIAGIDFLIIPRINYRIKDKFYIDFNFPLYVFNSNITMNKNDNPALTIQQRKIITFNLEELPDKFMVSLGLGVKI